MIENTIINMTPHPINIVKVSEDGSVEKTMTLQQSGNIIRLRTFIVEVGEICGVKITKTEFSVPDGLPEYQEGYFYIVSQIVKSALPERIDLLVPAEMLRDKDGNIVGCQSLGI
jgi:hypothetical protein